MSYILSKPTQLDIDAIYEYTLNKFGKKQALKYLVDLKTNFELLAKNPNIGKQRGEIKKGLYSLPYKSHIIFFRVFKNHIRIVRVLYGGRDLVKFLK